MKGLKHENLQNPTWRLDTKKAAKAFSCDNFVNLNLLTLFCIDSTFNIVAEIQVDRFFYMTAAYNRQKRLRKIKISLLLVGEIPT
jgi:hypothetical protein